MSELVLVFTHLPDREQVQRAARRMIRSHLAASAQIAPTEKIYYWHGQWREVTKWTLALMTTKTRYPALEAALRALHTQEGEPPPSVFFRLFFLSRNWLGLLFYRSRQFYQSLVFYRLDNYL